MDNIKQIFEEKVAKLKNKGIILMNIPVERAMQSNVEVMKALQLLGYKGVYVALSKDYQDLSRVFQYSGIDTDDLFFIDGIARMYGVGELNLPNVAYVEGPLSLDTILKEVDKAVAGVEGDKKFLFLDSMTAILLYNSIEQTLKFAKALAEILNKTKTVGITIGIIEVVSMGAANDKLIRELSKLSDENIGIELNS